jgi:hypothetical protein
VRDYVKLRDDAARKRAAVEKFLKADGHDLCHEERRELASAFGLAHMLPRAPATVEEFAKGCEDYMTQLYGRCPVAALRDAAFAVARVWDRQCGRVFESMGNENPRAQAIEAAIDTLKKALPPTPGG